MGVTIQWSGLNEFKEALRHLPEHLTDEASEIVAAAATGAADSVRANYPSVTGNLRRGVKVQPQERTRASVSFRDRSGAPHAHLFEKGTGPRQTRKGANRGRMPVAPAAQQMIPQVIRARARMVDSLVAMLEREGLLVSK